MSLAQTDHSGGSLGFLDRNFNMNWVFSARRDMLFLIGSVALGWAIFGIYLLLGWNMIMVWFVWVIVLARRISLPATAAPIWIARPGAP